MLRLAPKDYIYLAELCRYHAEHCASLARQCYDSDRDTLGDYWTNQASRAYDYAERLSRAK